MADIGTHKYTVSSWQHNRGGSNLIATFDDEANGELKGDLFTKDNKQKNGELNGDLFTKDIMKDNKQQNRMQMIGARNLRNHSNNSRKSKRKLKNKKFMTKHSR